MCVCVFISEAPITMLFAWGEGDSGGHVLRGTTSRSLCGLVCPSRTSERGGRLCERRRRRRGAQEGMCTGSATMPQPSTLRLIHIDRRMPGALETVCLLLCGCVFRTAVPSINVVCGTHHIRVGERGIVSERGGEGDCVKEGGGEEGVRERERALGKRLLCHSPRHGTWKCGFHDIEFKFGLWT
jgi:hypothetical protein